MAPASPGLDVGVSTLTNTRYQLGECPYRGKLSRGILLSGCFATHLSLSPPQTPADLFAQPDETVNYFSAQKIMLTKRGRKKENWVYIKQLKVLSNDVTDGFSECWETLLWA